MTGEPEKDQISSRQMRIVALVIAGTMTLWIFGNWVGETLGISARYRFLMDLVALAGFLWAFIVTFQIWRKRRG